MPCDTSTRLRMLFVTHLRIVHLHTPCYATPTMIGAATPELNPIHRPLASSRVTKRGCFQDLTLCVCLQGVLSWRQRLPHVSRGVSNGSMCSRLLRPPTLGPTPTVSCLPFPSLLIHLLP